MTSQKFVAPAVVMIRPLSFCSNPETLDSNSFQNQSDLPAAAIVEKARSEFNHFQKILQDKGIQLKTYEEAPAAQTPDALFPNNWFCHLPDKRVFIFPMQALNRQREYREDIILALRPREIIDLRFLLETDDFLEGTGSLILDHQFKIAYACRSLRTKDHALEVFSELSGYKIIAFDSVDAKGHAVYHSNVMMALSPKQAVINLESVRDAEQKRNLIFALQTSGRELIEISNSQMNEFAGNMLFLRNEKNEGFWICSERAFLSLTVDQKKALSSEGEILFAPLNTIENYGGGGARCLMAEVFQ